MTCKVSDILDRVHNPIPLFDSTMYFTLGPAQSAPPDIVLREPGWTLFCFDVKNLQAIFLDNGDGVDLSKAPFCGYVQYERAKKLALVPFSDFLALAEKIVDPKNVVQLFNIGHCGSTLLHHVFNRVPGVWCISEPACFFNLAMERDNIDDQTMRRLMRAGMRFLTIFAGAAEAHTIVVKQYSQLTTLLQTMHKAVPKTKSLFLYRDGKSWPNSHYHFIQKIGLSMIIPPEKRDFQWWILSGNVSRSEIEGIVDLHADVVTFDSVVAVCWALHMKMYLQAIKDGVPMLAVRYNELNVDRVKTIARIFDYLGISAELALTTLDAFDEDSHQGTRTARDKNELNFTDENYARVADVYARPRIAIDPNLILPDGVAV
jgi:Sulfotransferase domain